MVTKMRRRLVIDGNAVYEIDEDCMLRKRMDSEKAEKERKDRGKEKNQEQSK